MFSILKSAASGLLAQKYNLDVIANNIANINTTAFKKSRATFADAAYETAARTIPAEGETAIEYSAGTGVTVAAVQRIFNPGSLRETGNLLDLTILGDGFFQVAAEDGSKLYTRDGSFQLDGQGQLATLQGFLVDPPIAVPPDAESVQIDEVGVVRVQSNGQLKELGTVDVVTFPNPEGLLAVGYNLYAPSEVSGDANAGQAGTGGRGQIISGVLESSNVDLAEEMTRSIEAQRAYQLSIKVLQTADEMLALANNLRR